jgi:Fe-S-cluster-containing hydrogenase component 2
MLTPELQAGYARLRRLSVFDGIPNDELCAAIASGGIERRIYARDTIIAEPTSVTRGVAPIIFVASGQIAAGVFERADLLNRRDEQERIAVMSEEERKELSLLMPPPLARVAKKNVALFRNGDLFNAGALADGPGHPVAFFTVGPTEFAAIRPDTIAELATRFPFFEARFRRAIMSSRERLADITGVKQELLDFFVRHGVSVSGQKVRVRQLDRCIDCKQCEDACEERYGARRLTLGGYQLGMLDFVFTCRTCTDQRCIDPCEYDSIKFDENLREVVINEASCTGCTLCAQSCPFEAIEMIDIEDPHNPMYREDFKIRLDVDGSLNYGAGKPRVARARRIANKCDHCSGYRTQACVAACPTGSLIEIEAYHLFNERSPQAEIVAKSGYDQEVTVDHGDVLPTEPFTKGVGVKNSGLAKVRRGRWAPIIMWGVALGAWLLVLVEIILRTYAKTSSLQFAMLSKEERFADLPIEAVLLHVDYHTGEDLAIYCGFIGAGLLSIAAIYPFFRRIRAFRLAASNAMWFDFHMMAGIVGPMFILLHSAGKFQNPVSSSAFWAMTIVVGSGVIGRYLYTHVPDLLNGRELESLDNERAFARLRAANAFATGEAMRELEEHRHAVERVRNEYGLLRTLWWIIAEDLSRPVRRWRRKKRIYATAAPKNVAKELIARTGRGILIDRGRVIAPRAQLILHSWKKVHVPFTILLVVLAAWHIYGAWESV